MTPADLGNMPARRIVTCRANRGKKYRVHFDRNGNVTSVQAVFTKWQEADSGKESRRQIWPTVGNQTQSFLVRCAVHAAVDILAREAHESKESGNG